ncbi:ArfGap-domain-containing protein [Peniophora sp. CONT]|nr:ArfGap-domain-containing protein [Peniophora sp. CONT]
MDQTIAKRTLQELIKREDLSNKRCADCTNPNPQWASVSFAIFICLQCAGQHRGYGVHVSFVRSVSMDTWSEDQIRRMKLGGNGPFHDFLQSYEPADQGGYTPGMSTHDKYHCWAATQYREKLDSMLQDKPWSPSAPPADATSPPGRPSSAQGLRKSRAGTRGMSGLRTDSYSPASSAPNSPHVSEGLTQKSQNEAYFERLGNANASRPADLPPSQGGKYTGFGSTPAPDMHPSYGMSSRAAPTLSELQENPMAALSKGWSLFSGAVAGASKVITENVIQPGMERVQDPNFQNAVRGYVGQAQSAVTTVGSQANSWGRQQFGVDVAGQVGGIMGGRERAGYSNVSQGGYADESSALYHDDDNDDFFNQEFHGANQGGATSSSSATANKPAASGAKKANDGWEDDWKEF